MSCKKIFFHLLGGEKVLRVGENLSLVMRGQLIADFYDFLAPVSYTHLFLYR